jgi:hypothetical protein
MFVLQGNERYVRLEQFLNVYLLMLVTLSGIVISVSPVHPENALTPMLVTPSGIVIPVSPVHPENARKPMLVTLSGIIIP